MSSNTTKTCIRPGCGNTLNTGSMYCSKSCAARDRKRRESLDGIRADLSDEAQRAIPANISTMLLSKMGKDALPVLEEMSVVLEEREERVPPLLSYLTQGENLNLDPHVFGTIMGKYESYRPDDALSYDRIEKMLTNGQVVFGLEMKKSWIRSAFRNRESWRIDCQDEKVSKAIRPMVDRILQRHSNDFMEALAYGSYFGEKVFDRQPAPYWGIDGEDKYVGYHSIEPVYPPTITKIVYDGEGNHFDGYVQQKSHGSEVAVPPDRSLVLTYDQRFRNLWGRSILEPVYSYWAWYEIALRSMLRFLERMGTPVTVVYAPARGHIRDKNGNIVRTMKYAFLVASNVAKTNAIAIPSDVDPDTGKELWKVDYLSAPEKGQQFIAAVNHLGTQIIRALVIGDRTAMQPSGEAGSYGSSETHFAVTMLHNEHVLTQFISQFNSYMIPQLVRYNFGQGSPPAQMVTEGLDIREKERLFKLLSTMGNQADSHAMKYIDWRSIMNINNIPTLTDEDVKKIEDQALERQEKQMESASKFQAPAPPKGPPGQTIRQSADYVLYQLSTGAKAPVILTEEQAEEISDRYGERSFAVSLFNPYHDELGQFTTKALGGGGRRPQDVSSMTSVVPENYKTEEMKGHMQQNFRIILDEDGNRRAIFKAAAGVDEQIWPYNLWGGKAENFRGGKGIAGREVAASMVSKKLGMDDFVADTEWTKVDGMEGSAQEWMSGTTVFKLPLITMPAENRRRMAVFDYLIGNVDRHTRNMLWDKGKVYAIDNGYSFPAIGGSDFRKYAAGLANVKLYAPPIPTPSERAAIRSMLDDGAFIKSLAPMIGDGAVKDFVKRAEVYAS